MRPSAWWTRSSEVSMASKTFRALAVCGARAIRDFRVCASFQFHLIEIIWSSSVRPRIAWTSIELCMVRATWTASWMRLILSSSENGLKNSNPPSNPHRRKQRIIRLMLLEHIQQRRHALGGLHVGQMPPQGAGGVELRGIEQEFFFPGARLRDVQRGIDPLIGQIAIQRQFHVSS